jgi:hypothetical protein
VISWGKILAGQARPPPNQQNRKDNMKINQYQDITIDLDKWAKDNYDQSLNELIADSIDLWRFFAAYKIYKKHNDAYGIEEGSPKSEKSFEEATDKVKELMEALVLETLESIFNQEL